MLVEMIDHADMFEVGNVPSVPRLSHVCPAAQINEKAHPSKTGKGGQPRLGNAKSVPARPGVARAHFLPSAAFFN